MAGFKKTRLTSLFDHLSIKGREPLDCHSKQASVHGGVSGAVQSIYSLGELAFDLARSNESLNFFEKHCREIYLMLSLP